MKNNELYKAISALKKKYNVIPKEYTMYNGAFLFKIDEDCMNPFFLVDLKQKAVGPFSPAFDLDGFFEAAEKFRDL